MSVQLLDQYRFGLGGDDISMLCSSCAVCKMCGDLLEHSRCKVL